MRGLVRDGSPPLLHFRFVSSSIWCVSGIHASVCLCISPADAVAFVAVLKGKGFVPFTAKTNLVEHYRNTLGAKNIDAQTMYIDSYGAVTLIQSV